jgi:HEAT repeat protein
MELPTEQAQFAIEAIPRMGESGKPLIPIALGKLGSDVPFARFGAAGLVATLPPAEATKYAAELGKLATDKYPDIRRRVGLVLEKLGKAAAPAAEAVSRAYKEEKVETFRDQFLEALIAMESGAKPALAILLPLAREKSLNTSKRLRVIAAIIAADPTSSEVMSALMATAADGDQSIRAMAATALGKLDPLPPEALAKLVSLAKSDKQTGPKLAAVRAIAMAGSRAKTARADMEAIATGPQPGLALWAKVGLAAMDGELTRSAPAIHAALTNRDPSAREAAAQSLLLVGPTMTDLPVLIKLLRDLNAATRAASARCIGSFGTKAQETIPQLLPLLSDGDGDVRIAAVEAVGNIGVTSLPVSERLKALLADPLVQSAAAKTLEKLAIAGKK